MTTVFVRDLEVYAYHGVSPEERAVGHRLAINLTAHLEGLPSGVDRFEVSYAQLAATTESVARETRYQTLEALAIHLLEVLFRQHPSIQSLDIEIEKIAPPIPQIASSVGIGLSVERSELITR